MKRLLITAAKWLTRIVGPAIVSAIATAWVGGRPLTGLVRLRGLYDTFVRNSVPAWAFGLAFLAAIVGIYYAITHLPKRRPKGKVHFIPDAHNCGWSKQSDADMNARIGGTFTYDAPGELVILKAFLTGTEPTTDMTVQTEAFDGSGRMVTTSELWLNGGASQRTFIHMRLRPALGKPGRPVRRKLVLIDKFNRDFHVGPINFPYIGPKV
jgi:hypothetical protein